MSWPEWIISGCQGKRAAALQTAALVPLFGYIVLVQSSKKWAKTGSDMQAIYWGKCLGGNIGKEPEEAGWGESQGNMSVC